MSAAVVSHPITVLPPGPVRPELTIEHFDRAYQGPSRLPVSADFDGEAWSSPGIAFEDYTRMSTQRRKQSGERPLPTPQWALNQKLLRSVLVQYLETRAMLIKPQPGSEHERMRRALAVIEKRRPAFENTLKQMCAGYVRLKKSGCDAVRLKELAIEIENYDSVLRMNNANLPGTIIRIVHLYYSVGLDSVGVGLELGLKPPHVRQILWRLKREFERMNGMNQPTRVIKNRPSELFGAHKAKRGVETIARHLELLKNLAAQHGGKLPPYTWLNAHGYFRSYEVMRLNPKEFEKAGLQRSYQRRRDA